MPARSATRRLASSINLRYPGQVRSFIPLGFAVLAAIACETAGQPEAPPAASDDEQGVLAGTRDAVDGKGNSAGMATGKPSGEPASTGKLMNGEEVPTEAPRPAGSGGMSSAGERTTGSKNEAGAGGRSGASGDLDGFNGGAGTGGRSGAGGDLDGFNGGASAGGRSGAGGDLAGPGGGGSAQAGAETATVVVAPGEQSVFLSDLCAASPPQNGWGPMERDLSNGEEAAGDGGPITIGAAVFDKGLGMHAPARVSYALGGACSQLKATIGVDTEMRGAGSVIFEVWGDGERLYQSGLMSGTDPALAIDVAIAGIENLELVLLEDQGNGSDHGDWADAQVLCNDAELALCPHAPKQIPVPEGFALTWSDEFETAGRPNPANWGFEQGFARNEELQWYQEDNAWVQGGFLIIEARRDQVENPKYEAGSDSWKLNRRTSEFTSSSLRTSGKQHFQYGRFEMRARVVAEAGLWPAFWTLGESGEWPSNGEVDVFEFYGGSLHANVAVGTNTRWQAKWDSAAAAVSTLGQDWDSQFHVWRMDWNDDEIVLRVDDQVLNTTRLDEMLNPDGKSPFRQPHYILVNLALGGTAGGNPAGTVFPSHYEIDYVRVYQPL